MGEGGGGGVGVREAGGGRAKGREKKVWGAQGVHLNHAPCFNIFSKQREEMYTVSAVSATAASGPPPPPPPAARWVRKGPGEVSTQRVSEKRTHHHEPPIIWRSMSMSILAALGGRRSPTLRLGDEPRRAPARALPKHAAMLVP